MVCDEELEGFGCVVSLSWIGWIGFSVGIFRIKSLGKIHHSAFSF